MKNGFWVISIIFLLLGMAACDEDEEVTCDTAMGNFYDNYCLLVVDSSNLTESQAKDQCSSSLEYADDFGCVAEFDTVLDCMYNLDSSNATSQDELNAACQSCNAELTAADTCMNAAP